MHAHLYPPEYREGLRARGGASLPIADRLTRIAARDRFMDGAIDERLDMMDSLGVHRQVLSMPNQWVLIAEPELCSAHARLANDALSDVCQRYPERFRMFASLPLVDPAAALAELERSVTAHGSLGIIMPTHILGKPLDWDGLEPIWAEMERRRLPVFLHPAHPAQPVAPEGFPELGMTTALFFMNEDANAITRMVLTGVLERYPKLRVICPHLDGAVPFLLRRLDLHTESGMPDGQPLPHSPSHYLKKIRYDTVSLWGPAMRCACETFGPSQLLLGTDFPYVDGPGIQEIMTTIEELPVTPAERQGILEDNALEWVRW